ncbi:hypothetical protein KDW_30690 [Dictyobacter vulcani]|uniref:Uncharacterized protein n=1 Tax=Dictyobacter vulcani TaxID=2607529 RepID=A0A5J4KRC6_9CHLR|nr:hypothetical protein [Dictyobacter vulcani]GER88907.1 hypothetical protein KDW_30690 [Dictyobacter vulcani]
MDPLSREFQEKVHRESLMVRTDLVIEMQVPGRSHASQIPLIWIDALPKPEVATLWQKHEQYGEGDQLIRWLYFLNSETPDESTFYLDIQVTIPNVLHVQYFIAFPVLEHEELIERLTRVSEFSVMTDPGEEYKKLMQGKERQRIDAAQLHLLRQGLMYECPSEADRQELQKMLNQWRRSAGRRKR